MNKNYFMVSYSKKEDVEEALRKHNSEIEFENLKFTIGVKLKEKTQ